MKKYNIFNLNILVATVNNASSREDAVEIYCKSKSIMDRSTYYAREVKNPYFNEY